MRRGAVVLVRFPFSDLTASKLRPAVVLAEAGRDDYVLAQITSNPYADERAIELTDDSFEEGTLSRTSYARPGKLFTAHASLIVRVVGHLAPAPARSILDAVIRLLSEAER